MDEQDDELNAVLEILEQTLGKDNFHVINSKEDLLEFELKQYLLKGGYLH